MIIAGEVSGDMHAARLVRALRSRVPDAEVFGIGGEAMRETGVDVRYHTDEMAVMGFTDVVRRLGFFRRVFREMTELAATRRPDAVLLVDYPGFNLRFAARAHAMGVTVIYYICPQVWAWHRSRIARMAAVVDHLITIFPFEADVFDGTGLRADFVGHPLVGETEQARRGPSRRLPWSGTPRLALLPGSRDHEIARMLPVMWDAAAHLESRHPDLSCIIASPSARAAEVAAATVQGRAGGPARWSIVTGQTRHVLREARAAFVASGTATIESSLMRCPMVVVYRTALLTYLLARMLVKVPRIGMVNIVAGRPLCPEFIQHRATARRLAAAIGPLLDDTPKRAAMLQGLDDVNAALGERGAEDRAAELILDDLSAQQPATTPPHRSRGRHT
jgi:lipid-A-disaccharide synthase